MPETLVGYCRVSTQLQGHDGLGMEAQRRAVTAYANSHSASILAIYSEVETGRKKDLRNRPRLVSALAHARRAKAMLVIARLDRLARNVFVTSQLLESGVEFVACDNPHANRMSIQILAVMAEHESRMISERVKATVAVRRARGDIFHCYRRLTPEQIRMGQVAAAEANRRRTREAYADLVPIVRRLRESGDPLRSIAASLNELGHRTQGGGHWSSAGVHRLLKREGLGHLRSRSRIRPPIDKKVQLIGTAIAGRQRTARARTAYAPLVPLVAKLTAAGVSAIAIADALNQRRHKMQLGTPWSYATVLALQRREDLVAAAVPTGIRGGFRPEVRMRGGDCQRLGGQVCLRISEERYATVCRSSALVGGRLMYAAGANSSGRGRPWTNRSGCAA